MNIPEEIHMKAYRAAEDVTFVDGHGNTINGPIPHSAQIEAAVDAAAPFIAAQALRDAADQYTRKIPGIGPWGKPAFEHQADWLRARAEELESK